MKKSHQNYLLYLVGLTVLVTIGIQIYWNHQNYLINQKLLLREVQDCLDRSVYRYYEETSKDNYVSLIDTTSRETDVSGTLKLLKIFDELSLGLDGQEDNLPRAIRDSLNVSRAAQAGILLLKGRTAGEARKGLAEYPNRITLSVNQDSIRFPLLKAYLDADLQNRQIETTYEIHHLKKDSVFASFGEIAKAGPHFNLASTSELIPDNEGVELVFENPVKSIYQKGLVGILLSLLLSCSILFSLFYLLKVIRRQKELAVIKNDFMSNITHELKTPISTAKTALEGISKFNDQNDPEKTKRYLEISDQQLNKLDTLVEKILDTASLHSERLLIAREETDVTLLLERAVSKYRIIYPGVNIALETGLSSKFIPIDPFHFENAVNNLIDNACKYGKGKVRIGAEADEKGLRIRVMDNGPGIPKKYRREVFEKFFRIPQGNRHDVKGFGIGLYYAQKIIQKHGGSLLFDPADSWPAFVITLSV